ncbi:MAG: hypothetical protein WCS42_01835 [Verrucomicrobiota bacterium]
MNWYQNALTEIKSHLSAEDLPDAERQARCLAAIDGLHHLFHELLGELKIRDKWADLLCDIAPFSTGTVERSLKLEQEFRFSVCMDGWVIESGLSNASHIRHMTDEFWGHIAALATVGKASLNDSGILESSPVMKKLIQHKGSLVFSLARDYVLLMQGPQNSVNYPCGTLGGIQIVLPLKTEESKVRKFFKDGLSGLYRANYLLHRSAYLEFKRLQKAMPTSV